MDTTKIYQSSSIAFPLNNCTWMEAFPVMSGESNPTKQNKRVVKIENKCDYHNFFSWTYSQRDLKSTFDICGEGNSTKKKKLQFFFKIIKIYVKKSSYYRQESQCKRSIFALTLNVSLRQLH